MTAATPQSVNNRGETIPLMDIAEFRDLGFLQELNRKFLHPLGLALYTMFDDETGEVTLDIGDYRADPAGLFFSGADLRENQEEFQCRARLVSRFGETRMLERMNRIGICFDPVGVDPDEEVPMMGSLGIQPINWYPLPPVREEMMEDDSRKPE